METKATVELRDLDGSYILSRIVDETRCRVLASNVTGRGETIRIPFWWCWEDATRNLGGFTRTSPYDVLQYTHACASEADEDDDDSFERDLKLALDEEEEVLREAHRLVEERAGGSGVPLPESQFLSEEHGEENDLTDFVEEVLRRQGRRMKRRKTA